jgi:hypothetical protein
LSASDAESAAADLGLSREEVEAAWLVATGARMLGDDSGQRVDILSAGDPEAVLTLWDDALSATLCTTELEGLVTALYTAGGPVRIDALFEAYQTARQQVPAGGTDQGDQSTTDQSTTDQRGADQGGADQRDIGLANIGVGQDETGQSEPDQRNIGQSETGQSESDQRGAGQDETRQGNIGQSETGQSETGQRGAGQDESDQRGIGQGNIGQRGAGQSETGQGGVGQSESGQSESGLGEPVDLSAALETLADLGVVDLDTDEEAGGLTVGLSRLGTWGVHGRLRARGWQLPLAGQLAQDRAAVLLAALADYDAEDGEAEIAAWLAERGRARGRAGRARAAGGRDRADGGGQAGFARAAWGRLRRS